VERSKTGYQVLSVRLTRTKNTKKKQTESQAVIGKESKSGVIPDITDISQLTEAQASDPELALI